MAACCAANGVPLREPRKPSEPALFHETVLPMPSEMVTMVLLNDARMCTSPWGTFLRSFFLNFLVLPLAAPAAGACAFAIVEISYGAIAYVLAAVFFLFATVPLRGPLRVRALVWVRWPRTGRLRR